MSIKLPKTIKKSGKRLGRGYGSGKGGHTVGRGTKGQKARNKNNILFEGVKMKKSFIKRLPLKRGKGKFKARQKPIIVKLEYLNIFKTNTDVNLDVLASEGIVKRDDAQKYGVKILGGGELKKKLTINLPVSNSAEKQIKKAGGKVVKESVKKQEPSSSESKKITKPSSNKKKSSKK